MKVVVNQNIPEVKYMPLRSFNEDENYGKVFRDSNGNLYFPVGQGQYISVAMIGGSVTVYDSVNNSQDRYLLEDVKVVATNMTATLTIE